MGNGSAEQVQVEVMQLHGAAAGVHLRRCATEVALHDLRGADFFVPRYVPHDAIVPGTPRTPDTASRVVRNGDCWPGTGEPWHITKTASARTEMERTQVARHVALTAR